MGWKETLTPRREKDEKDKGASDLGDRLRNKVGGIVTPKREKPKATPSKQEPSIRDIVGNVITPRRRGERSSAKHTPGIAQRLITTIFDAAKVAIVEKPQQSRIERVSQQRAYQAQVREDKHALSAAETAARIERGEKTLVGKATHGTVEGFGRTAKWLGGLVATAISSRVLEQQTASASRLTPETKRYVAGTARKVQTEVIEEK